MLSFFYYPCSMYLKAVAVLYVKINYAELISYPADSLSREYISAEAPCSGAILSYCGPAAIDLFK